MAVIENKYWNGEPLKAVFKFSSDQLYTIYSDNQFDETENYIYNASLALSEGNSKVNPLGISTSNRLTLQVYDANDSLSPANMNSIYYGKVVNGVAVDLYISYDNETWTPFYKWYTTNISGGFADGWHGMANVSLEDKLNTLGNYDLPSLPAYANVQAGDLIANVFNGLGIGQAEYTIDPVIDQTLLYGVAQGLKVREFLNNICQLLFAKVVIDNKGIIRFVPALSVYNNSNEITLNADDTGTFQNKNTSNVNYNEIEVKYLLAGDISRETIFSDGNHTLAVGTNNISDITFKNKVLSVESVECLYESANSTADITSQHFEGYMDGIALTIVLSGEAVNNCKLIGEGIVVSTTSKSVKVSVDNASVIGGQTFTFDTKQMMTEAQATVIANSLRTYLKTISRNVIMNGSSLTPKLSVGDKVIIADTGTMYNGVYKVIALNITMGENYSLDVTLIRIS